MDPQAACDVSRRRFGLQALGFGGALLASTQLTAYAAETVPNQATGPVQQGGLSPRLTMHALDTYHGTPAAGMRVDFSRIDGERITQLATVTLAPNGRSEPPLLIGDSYRVGTYELLLHADDYFAMRHAVLPRPAFLSKIPIRFRVVDAGQRIHLPVLFGPWNYTYYRGS
ncbi:hydroxyisourate hydrolase [Pandoraea terrae]|nr:hydroxyisourate hydrolase [Pandoraea terrae]